MKQTIRSLMLAGTALAGLSFVTPAHAIAPPPPPAPTGADFSILEADIGNSGTYTLVNNSADAYVYYFSVTNPMAGLGAIARTSQSGWTPYTYGPCVGSCSGNGSFAYSSNDPFNFSLDVGPNSTSSLFTFGPAPAASTYVLDVIANGQGYQFSGTAVSAVPLPPSWALMLGALGLGGLGIGWRSWRGRSPAHSRPGGGLGSA